MFTHPICSYSEQKLPWSCECGSCLVGLHSLVIIGTIHTSIYLIYWAKQTRSSRRSQSRLVIGVQFNGWHRQVWAHASYGWVHCACHASKCDVLVWRPPPNSNPSQGKWHPPPLRFRCTVFKRTGFSCVKLCTKHLCSHTIKNLTSFKRPSLLYSVYSAASPLSRSLMPLSRRGAHCIYLSLASCPLAPFASSCHSDPS